MSEKGQFNVTAPMPSGPPMAGGAMQQHPEPPPPYSPYATGPTELDASMPYPPQNEKGAPIGFQMANNPPAPQQVAAEVQGGAIPGQVPVTVITQPQIIQQVVTTVVPLGPNSVRMTCPFCKADMNTSTAKDPSIPAYITAAVCCLIGCFWGCCLIPFCMDSCKKTEHHCPNCKRFLGRYSQY